MDNVDKSPQINILLVDDQLSSLLVLQEILKSLRVNIIKANSAKHALRIMLKENIDCILLDVSMPEMDGFDFLKIINDAPSHASIPVIMVTGKIFSDNETIRAYQCGAVDFLLKPLDSEIVYRKVSFFVNHSIELKCVYALRNYMDNLEKDFLLPLREHQNNLSKEQSQDLNGVISGLVEIQGNWQNIKDRMPVKR
jgi:response regulator RpfG family c-di-GMP phosphodiesterase